MKSIKMQEDEENDDIKKSKKKVTIISVEEEEDMVKQINEIRDRIRRGEIIGPQKSSVDSKTSQHNNRLSSGNNHAFDNFNFTPHYSKGQNNYHGLEMDSNYHFRSVDGASTV
jgi:hypothetical protein